MFTPNPGPLLFLKQQISPLILHKWFTGCFFKSPVLGITFSKAIVSPMFPPRAGASQFGPFSFSLGHFHNPASLPPSPVGVIPQPRVFQIRLRGTKGSPPPRWGGPLPFWPPCRPSPGGVTPPPPPLPPGPLYPSPFPPRSPPRSIFWGPVPPLFSLLIFSPLWVAYIKFKNVVIVLQTY